MAKLEELEANDCTVKAISQAYDISYSDAHSICAKYGREFRNGFHFQAKLAADLKMKLCSMNFIGMSIGRALKYINPEKVYICLVSAHLFCIKGGKPLDGTPTSKRVIRLWEVTKPPCKYCGTNGNHYCPNDVAKD